MSTLDQLNEKVNALYVVEGEKKARALEKHLSKANPVKQPKESSDRRSGLTNRELTELFGFKSSGAVSNAAAQGDTYFREWSAGYDPEGKAWTFEGENKNRRFYPVGEVSTLNGCGTVA